jgi:FKBP12-rapamycin complex-associated protein
VCSSDLLNPPLPPPSISASAARRRVGSGAAAAAAAVAMKPSPHFPEIGKKPKDLIAKEHGFNIAAYISSGADVIAAALRKHVEEEARDLSGEAFLRFMEQLYEQICSLLQSNDVAENLLALRAIDALIDMPFGEGASKVSKFANFLRTVFEVKRDPEVLVPASAVLGHLAKAGGAMTADEVERQVNCNYFSFFLSIFLSLC